MFETESPPTLLSTVLIDMYDCSCRLSEVNRGRLDFLITRYISKTCFIKICMYGIPVVNKLPL